MDQVDTLLRSVAEKAYARAIAEWEADFEREKERNAQRLADPDFATSLGLPPDLPPFTVDILKYTMALDKLGPKMPNRADTYRHYCL